MTLQGVVEMLLRDGADVHRELGPSRDKKTPLMLAASCGDLDIVKLLIAHDAKIEHKGTCTPLNCSHLA